MLKIATKFLPKPSAFEAAQSANVQYAEFWLDAQLLSRWREIAALAQGFPLSYVLHFPNRQPLSEQTPTHTVELYRALGCRAMVIHRPMLEEYGDQLTALEGGIRLAVENHRLAPDEFERWASENQWLTLDIEHLWKFTLRDAPLEELMSVLNNFLSRYASKLLHVHLPGYLPGQKEHRPMYCSREMVLGAFCQLADAGFDGFVVSEVNPPFQNVHEMKMDLLLYQKWRELRQSSHL